jgi:hypothetical protein
MEKLPYQLNNFQNLGFSQNPKGHHIPFHPLVLIPFFQKNH